MAGSDIDSDHVRKTVLDLSERRGPGQQYEDADPDPGAPDLYGDRGAEQARPEVLDDTGHRVDYRQEGAIGRREARHRVDHGSGKETELDEKGKGVPEVPVAHVERRRPEGET